MSLPPKIYDENGRASFGGSQMWLPDPMLLNSGCGIIAGLDAITRLKGEEGMTRKEYFAIRNTEAKPILFKWWEKIPGYLEGGDPLVMLFVSPFKKITVEYPDGWKAMCDYHWVTITEMDGDTLWVSSWGERCRMSVKELKRFGVILRFYSVSLEKQSDIV